MQETPPYKSQLEQWVVHHLQEKEMSPTLALEIMKDFVLEEIDPQPDADQLMFQSGVFSKNGDQQLYSLIFSRQLVFKGAGIIVQVELALEYRVEEVVGLDNILIQDAASSLNRWLDRATTEITIPQMNKLAVKDYHIEQIITLMQ